MVTVTSSASSESSGRPRSRPIRTPGPTSARAAGAETHERIGPDELQLRLEPRPAGCHVRAIRTLVNPALSARLVAEMLDDVGQEHLVVVYLRELQTTIEDPSGRTHERTAFDVLTVARLLADEHQGSIAPAVSDHRLRRPLPQLASTTLLHGITEAPQRETLRDRGTIRGRRGHRLERALPV